MAEDRLTLLLQQSAVTGIDFVQVVDPEDQTVLRVFFLINPDQLDDPIVTGGLPIDVSTSTVTIHSTSGGERLADVPIVRTTFVQITINGENRTALEIKTSEPGDFSLYRLTIIDEPKRRVDRFFNGVVFSFKQGCPSVLDCKPPGLVCPIDEIVDFPIDYLARDFISFRNALLDFAAQRYPRWAEKVEADAGIMLMEVLAALGDDLSYIQDRYSREAYLETASQRRSLRHLTQLVDYNIHDGLAASTFLDLTVNANAGGFGGVFVKVGKRVWAPAQGEAPIPFELGRGLRDTESFWVQAAWNTMPVHVPDESQPCLDVGTTELFLRGHFPLTNQIPAGEDPLKFWIGKWVLLRSDPTDPSIPARRFLVQLVAVEQTSDPLFRDASNIPLDITRIQWNADQALPFELCLHDVVVRGNLVPATAGETFTELFSVGNNASIPPDDASRVDRTVERQGSLNDVTCDRSIKLLYSLKETEKSGLGWLGILRNAQPEVELQEVDPVQLQPLQPPHVWEWRPTLLDSRGFEDQFALEDGTWRRIVSFRRIGETIVHVDYATGSGFSIRFGDGEFGRIPGDGTVFQVRYRTGPGSRANLPADTIINLSNPANPAETDLAGVLDAVTNPLAVTSGIDPEDPDVIRQLAPEAFRAITFRAVRPEDYAHIAERLPGVQRAGARFRWTGSWLSVFVTADPLGSFQLSPELRKEIANLMDAVRQAGREVFVRDPRYVNIDLIIEICVEPFAYGGQVKAAVLEALLGRKSVRPFKGFFDPDNFTFGTPLRRAALEAAIQEVSGVRAVEEIRIRARGITGWRVMDELTFEVHDDQIIRLQNDPKFPERGSLKIVVREEVQA
jgi:hypothetical protein